MRADTQVDIYVKCPLLPYFNQIWIAR